ncbi:MAG: tripartite tricarboxylate transporter TctB family protein [Candidatus Binatia bacterium]
MKGEGLAFTAFVGCVMAGALWVARDWPVRASIGVLTLGSVGVILALWQFMLDLRSKKTTQERSAFEIPTVETETKWGNVEIWSWIVGFYSLILLVGFPVAVPLFVLAYGKAYGASWRLAACLSVLAWGFVYGVFEKILHVPWPTPFIHSLFWG